MKTFTYWDKNEIPKILRTYQIYGIPQGDSCNQNTDVANDMNVIIIAFWGTTSIEAIRINDLIATLRLENYTKENVCRNRNLDELTFVVFERMNEGKELLKGSMGETLPFSRVYEFVRKFGMKNSIHSFFQDLIFYLMETFHDTFSE